MKYDYKEISTIVGVFIALNIGAGFASGQEIFQFFSSYGLLGFLGGLISFLLLVFSCESVIDAGWIHRFCVKTSVFEFFCGKFIGSIYSILIPLALYGSFVIMISGVGVVLEEFFQIPNWMGRIVVLALVIGSIFCDFHSLARMISQLGKFVAGIIIIICLIVIWDNDTSLFSQIKVIPTLEFISAGHTYYLAGILYAGSIVLVTAQFLFEYGRTIVNRQDGFLGIAIGAFIYMLAAMIVHLVILLNFQEVYQLKIITLYFANKISPVIAVIMAILIPVVMASSSISGFWSIGSIIKKKTNIPKMPFYGVSVFLAIAGYFLAEIPFDRLVNILYPINGLLGVGFVAFICLKNRLVARRIQS